MRRHARGYTAIEVMVSMAILAIGAGAVISMQRGAVQGNVDARRIDTANAITRLWVERLRNEAMLWTRPNSQFPNATDDNRTATNTPLLATVDGQWFAPVAHLDDTVPQSPGFDLLGRDLARADVKDAAFCTQIRLTWLAGTDMMRAEVRVFWPRGLGVPMNLDCTSPAATNVLDTNTNSTYRFVHATTAIRRNAF